MSKLTITMAALGVVCWSAQAAAQAPLTYLSLWTDEDGVRLSGYPSGVMEGAPMFRFSIQEMAYGVGEVDRPGWYSARLHYFERVDEPTVGGYDYGDGFGYRYIFQTYRVPTDTSKTFTLHLYAEYLPSGAGWAAQNGPAIRITAGAEWPNGLPANYSGQPVTAFGVVLRSDHDVPGSNNQGFEVATGWRGALSAARFGSWDAFTRRQWDNVPSQPLARFFDTNERQVAAAGGPVFDMYMLSNDDANQRYHINVRRYLDDQEPQYQTMYQFLPDTPPQTVIEPLEGRQLYPSYVAPGGGSDQVAYMEAQKLRASTSSYEWLDFRTLLVKRDHYRTIDLQWFYAEPQYGDPDYVADDGNSVRSVLESLDPASPVYVRTQQVELTCPGNECSEGELIDLQYANNYDWGEDKSVLKTAVYVLQSDQSFPGAGGVTYPTRAHGFVFPKMLAEGDRRSVYSAIAHELGHTFKFEHSWSRCGLNDACPTSSHWCCENGDLMSYAHGLGYQQGWQHFDFNYTADAKRWFMEAPLPFVESFTGGAAGAVFPDLDGGVEPAAVLGW